MYYLLLLQELLEKRGWRGLGKWLWTRRRPYFWCLYPVHLWDNIMS